MGLSLTAKGHGALHVQKGLRLQVVPVNRTSKLPSYPCEEHSLFI